MNSKKAITLLVLATLMMTLVPLVPVQAITVDVSDDTVSKGDEIDVTGDGVPGGRTINIYWDDLDKETFTEGSGKLASTKATRDGTYTVEVTIPEGIAGLHYIYAKDSVTDDWDLIAVTVLATVTVASTSGLESEKVTVTGYGYGYDEEEEEGYDVVIEVTDDYLTVIPFVFSPEVPVTNFLGTWTATMTVPDQPYGVYTITATDEGPDTNTDDVPFTIGASITLNIVEGPTGTVVTITGRGFDDEEDLTVAIDGTTCVIVSGEVVRSDGRITTRIIIPSVVIDEYTITVMDEVGGPMTVNIATADFEVNGEAEVKAIPSFGSQGGQIIVEGWNYTRISNTDVAVTLNGAGSRTFTTDNQGHFRGTFTVPAIGTDPDADLVATDENSITATDSFRVGIMLAILTPSEVPSGGLVAITAVGLLDGEAYTVSIGDMEWFTGTTSGTTISETRNVPTMVPGTYTVSVMEDESEIEVTSSLVITHQTMVELDPVTAPNEYPVTIEGFYFAEDPSDDSLEFILYNATSEWILEVWYDEDGDGVFDVGEVTVTLGLDDDWDEGYFMGTFLVPDEDVLSLGAYSMNVTDGEGMFAQFNFQVVSKITTITPRKSTFRIGETIAFNVESSFKQEGAYVKISDPSGDLYWTTDPFMEANWMKVGTLQVYPFYQQTAGGNPMVALEDAPLGIYTWVYYDADDEELDTGSFTVAAASESVLGQQIEDLNEAVTDLQSDISTVSTEVAAVRTQLTNAVNAANAAVEAANAATQAVNAVAQTANSATQAAQQAATAATEAKNAANGLTTLVYGAIGASLVAALAAIVSLMQISRRIAG